MDIYNMNLYNSPNIYSLKDSIVKMSLRLGDLYNTPTKDIKDFNSKIIDFFPGIKKHKCALDYEGGFVQRLSEGTYLAHVTEHLCLELQDMLGYKALFGKARLVQDDLYDVIFACESLTIGKACGVFVVNLINNLIEGKSSDFKDEYKKLKEFCALYDLGPSTRAIIEEAKLREIPIQEIQDSGILRLGFGKYQKYLSSTIYEETSCISVDIACDKSLSKYLLEEEQLPVATGEVCISLESALKEAQNQGYPVVLKPRRGNHGNNVFVNIYNPDELKGAFLSILGTEKEVIVEKCIQGQDYRLLVVNGKMVAAAKRVPAYVIGDGKSNIKELINIENQNVLRGDDHEKPLTKISIDQQTINLLEKQGRSLYTIPALNEEVQVKSTANLSTGGIAIDCTDLVHSRNREAAELAAKLIGLDIAGVDMIIPDITNPIGKDYGAIVEINAAPGIRMHLHPSIGTPRNVAADILDMIYPRDSLYSIPIISVTGTNGKTTTTRMISHILMRNGLNVGKTSTDGIFINNECIVKCDASGPKSAHKILNSKSIDAAVLETARGGILREGLAYQKADIAIFTNLSEDHLGIDGVNTLDELLHIKSLVIEAVKDSGTCILNADDQWVMKAKEKARGKVLLFSLDYNNSLFPEHLESGGSIVYVKNGGIFHREKNVETHIMELNDIPATLNGKLKHNIYNSLASIGACFSFGVSSYAISSALKTFNCDIGTNPGRFNVFDMNDFKVIIDYGHNIEGYRATIEGIRSLMPRRMVGIIGMPGDRDDDHIKRVADIAAKSFDYILIKEDHDLRGRRPLEVANIMLNRTSEQGMSRDNIKIIPNEAEALKVAMNNARQGDVITVFYEKMEPLINTINEFQQNNTIQ